MININSGKKFEEAIKNSVPNWCIYYRLKDPPQSFNKSESLRFSWKNPCDVFLFDAKYGKFMALELKSTKENSMSFEDININEKQNKMIHKHQILALKEYGEFANTHCGFLFNFRDEEKHIELTYYQDIKDFIIMTTEINKKSFNISDLHKYNAISIKGFKKRTKYDWSICELINTLNREE